MNFIDFDKLSSFATLKNLARSPFDLRRPSVLSFRSRLSDYTIFSEPFELNYGFQRVDDEILSALQAMADEAGLIDKFMAMKQGEVLNYIAGVESENRQVLHTACRDVFRDTPDCLQAAAEAREQLQLLKGFLHDLDSGRLLNEQGQAFETMVQVGIGGSELGPRVVCQALETYARPGRKVRFIANVDPGDASAVFADIDISRTIFNVVSKSGSTMETSTNEAVVRQALREKGLDPARHIIAVTGKGSRMDDKNKYARIFYMFDYIGGRYSVSSMVGMVVLGFLLGYEQVMEFLAGAHRMDVSAEERSIEKNIPLMMAMLGIWNRNFLDSSSLVILPYSQALDSFVSHIQQCDMESNGKMVSRQGKMVSWKTGPIVWGGVGTRGQHAFYQLLHQGTEEFSLEFIGFCRSQTGYDLEVEGTTLQEKLLANMFAQARAFAEGQDSANPNKFFPGNTASSILLADKLTPETMGALMALYEHKIVFQGFCWSINSFDQEGVQLGKKLAVDILRNIETSRCGRHDGCHNERTRGACWIELMFKNQA